MATSSASTQDPKTMSIICWIFSPIISAFFLSDTNETLKWHAKQSFRFGLISLGIYIILFVGSTFLSIITFGLGSLLYCLMFLWMLVDFPVRLYGAYQASNGVQWKVPVIGDLFPEK